jgi:hypothetical protein
MFRTKKRSEEPDPQQEPRNAPSPKELLAKEAQMAEKLLGDLVPEEPPTKKDTEGQKPEGKAEVEGQKPESREGVQPPMQQGPAGPEGARAEEKPSAAEQKPEEAKKEEGAGPVGDDQLPVLMGKIQQLGNELVGIRSEIRKLREGYTAKTKEMEELQAKLKETLTQVA